MAITHCIVCDEEFDLAGRIKLGQKVTCPHCGARLEVVVTSPLEVDYADEEDAESWAADPEDELEGELDEEADAEDDLLDDDLDDDIAWTTPKAKPRPAAKADEDEFDDLDDDEFSDDFDDDEFGDDDEFDDDEFEDDEEGWD